MRPATRLAILLSIVVLGVAAALAAPIGGGPNDNRRDLAQPPGVIGGGAPGLPSPIEPLPSPGIIAGVHIVGFTIGRIPADRGGLNLALLCQTEFPGSRVCSVDDVLEAVVVPPSPPGRTDYVWVRGAGSPTVHDLLLPSHAEGETTGEDCRGWTSAAKTDIGVAIALGPDHGCFGGFVTTECNHELALACCAIVRP